MKMPTICQGCGYVCDEKRPLDDVLYYCMIFHKWLCHDCYNLPGPKAWAQRRTALAGIAVLLLCLLCGCGEKPKANPEHTNQWVVGYFEQRTNQNGNRCEKCGYSSEDAPTNAWPDAEISRDRFRAMLDNESARRQHAFRSNQHYHLHGGAVKP